jgi:aminopeptidase YwaD
VKQLYRKILEKVEGEASGVNAKNIVSEIIRYHRIQASPGFREAATYCKEWFKENGFDSVEMLEFPGDGKQLYWSYRMPEAWAARDAELRIVSPKKSKKVLCRYRDVPLSLIQRSAPTPSEGIEAEVIILEDGTEERDYKGKDVKGKIVLTSGDLELVKALAVDRHGAIGIITDRMPEFPPVRHRMDVANALCYTSFWWRISEKKCFGFVVSPKEGERLRNIVKHLERKKRLRMKLEEDEKEVVRVHAKVDSEFYNGTCEDVTAVIKGRDLPKEEVLVIAHLCHPLPSANDNASGCAAAMESARCLNNLISEGELPRPRRTIRFLLVPEMTGTYAYLATHEKNISKIIAGVNLDMVGHDQDVTKGPLLVEKTPEANPSSVSYLMAKIMKDVAKGRESFGGTGEYALFKWAVTSYSGGSDHYILSDPSVGVPTPMIIHWPDRYYHTSQDTIDKVSAEELKRVVMMTSTYAYFLANAGYDECLWLTNQVVTEAKKRILDTVQDELSQLMAEENRLKKPEKIVRTMKEVEERVSYVLNREIGAFWSIDKIVPKKEKKMFKAYLRNLETDVKRLAKRELERTRQAEQMHCKAKGYGELPVFKKPRIKKDEKIAATIIPKRIYKGPISMDLALEKMTEEERVAYLKMMLKKKKFWSTLDLAVYWTDGVRSLLEISRLVKQEAGKVDLEFLIDYFKIITNYGLIKVEKKTLR